MRPPGSICEVSYAANDEAPVSTQPTGASNPSGRLHGTALHSCSGWSSLESPCDPRAQFSAGGGTWKRVSKVWVIGGA